MPLYISSEPFTMHKPFRVIPAGEPFEFAEIPEQDARGRGWRLASEPAPPPPPAPKQVPGSAPKASPR